MGSESRQILSLVRIPISPLRLGTFDDTVSKDSGQLIGLWFWVFAPVWAFGFRSSVSVFGFRSSAFGFRLWISALGFPLWLLVFGFKFRISNLKCR